LVIDQGLTKEALLLGFLEHLGTHGEVQSYPTTWKAQFPMESINPTTKELAMKVREAVLALPIVERVE
jgi:hypothetical protein